MPNLRNLSRRPAKPALGNGRVQRAVRRAFYFGSEVTSSAAAGEMPINATKIIPFILVGVLSAASACYAADPTLDGGHMSSGAATHGVIGKWLSRLQQMGFKVYAPNSFGEPRHPASCKPPFPNKSAIYSLRLDQTIRAIKELRTKHPESKLYIWGHEQLCKEVFKGNSNWRWRQFKHLGHVLHDLTYQ
jgi:hypothetical protein